MLGWSDLRKSNGKGFSVGVVDGFETKRAKGRWGAATLLQRPCSLRSALIRPQKAEGRDNVPDSELGIRDVVGTAGFDS